MKGIKIIPVQLHKHLKPKKWYNDLFDKKGFCEDKGIETKEAI